MEIKIGLSPRYTFSYFVPINQLPALDSVLLSYLKYTCRSLNVLFYPFLGINNRKFELNLFLLRNNSDIHTTNHGLVPNLGFKLVTLPLENYYFLA